MCAQAVCSFKLIVLSYLIQNQDEQDGNTNEEDENRENPEDGEEETDSNSPQGNIPPQRLSTFRAHVNILYTFFTSFFTSLVPQAAQ